MRQQAKLLRVLETGEMERVGSSTTRSVDVRMTLTAPGCGMGEVLVHDVKEKIQLIPTVRDAAVELVFDPPWSRDNMSEAARLQTGMF